MTEYYHGTVADKIIEMGKAKDFITIAIGMLNNPRCDLDGAVGKYANDMDAIVRRAEHELDEEEKE